MCQMKLLPLYTFQETGCSLIFGRFSNYPFLVAALVGDVASLSYASQLINVHYLLPKRPYLYYLD